MTLPLQLSGIPNVTPSYTFQDKGLGAAVQEGVAGLIQALQAKAHIDQQAQELDQQERDLQSTIQSRQSGMAVDAAQIKKIKDEIAQKTKDKESNIAAYRAFAPISLKKGYLDDTAVANAIATLKNDPVAIEKFNALVKNAVDRHGDLLKQQQDALDLQQDRAKKPGGTGTTPTLTAKMTQAEQIWQRAESLFNTALAQWGSQDRATAGPPPKFESFLQAEARRDGTTAGAIKRLRRQFWGPDAAMPPQSSHQKFPRGQQSSKRIGARDKRIAEVNPEFAQWLVQQGYDVG